MFLRSAEGGVWPDLSEETLAAWREHPEHLEAQRLGRERFYEEFELMTCVPLRAWGFKRSS